MNIFDRNAPRVVKPKNTNFFIIAAMVLVFAIGIGIVLLVESHHRNPTGTTTFTGTPADATGNVDQNAYTVGESVYCYDQSGPNNSGPWYPCTILGIANNH